MFGSTNIMFANMILARTAQTTKVFSPVFRFVFGYRNIGSHAGVEFLTSVLGLNVNLKRASDPSAPDPCLATVGKFGGKTSHGRTQTPLHGVAHAHTHTLIHVHAPYVLSAHPTDDVCVIGLAVLFHVLELLDVKLLPGQPLPGIEAFVVPHVHHSLPPLTHGPIHGFLVRERPIPKLHTGKPCVQT
jgi:hypothetical protein